MSATRDRSLATYLIKDRTVFVVILLNGLVLILDAFPGFSHPTHRILFWIDYGCMLFFIVEAVIKIQREAGPGFRKKFLGYWQSDWNKMDFWIIVASAPLLASPFFQEDVLEKFAVLLLFRLGRLMRFTKVMHLVPDADRIWEGIVRALKASVAVFLVMFMLLLILSMGANLLFFDPDIPATHAYFGDPIKAFYTLFKVFTIEGWYEIPDRLAASGMSVQTITGMRGYFMASVFVGGLLGLSLANAVFVDEMTSDNTEKVERMVADLHRELQAFREEMQQGAS